jgi:hypothetical protein
MKLMTNTQCATDNTAKISRHYLNYSLKTIDRIVTDKGNGGQPACPEEWKKCKEEHE